MKQTKHKHIVSIWHRPPKGVRAGNSPVWKPKFTEEERQKIYEDLVKSEKENKEWEEKNKERLAELDKKIAEEKDAKRQERIRWKKLKDYWRKHPEAFKNKED